MKTQHCDRLKHGLETALERLRMTPKTEQNQNEIWVGTSEVLHWLYKCEEAEKKANEDYYKDRELSVGGCTLAGLVWVRGQVVHKQAEVQERTWVPITLHTLSGKAVKMLTLKGEEVILKSCVVRWPIRSKLPDQKMDPHGRDTHYETYVQEKELLPPLELAIAYLLDR